MKYDSKEEVITWVIIAGFILFCTYGCQKPLEEREDYQSGYEAGESDGYDAGLEDGKSQGREEICDNIATRLNYEARNAVCY